MTVKTKRPFDIDCRRPWPSKPMNSLECLLIPNFPWIFFPRYQTDFYSWTCWGVRRDFFFVLISFQCFLFACHVLFAFLMSFWVFEGVLDFSGWASRNWTWKVPDTRFNISIWFVFACCKLKIHHSKDSIEFHEIRTKKFVFNRISYRSNSSTIMINTYYFTIYI